jgi:hypothetical protein
VGWRAQGGGRSRTRELSGRLRLLATHQAIQPAEHSPTTHPPAGSRLQEEYSARVAELDAEADELATAAQEHAAAADAARCAAAELQRRAEAADAQ